MGRLAGKTALITGAGDGIGRRIALELAREGAAVAVLDIDRSSAERTAAEAASLSGRSMPVVCDVAQRDEAFAAVTAVASQWGELNILVNNAIWFHYTPLTEATKENVGHVLDVGLKGSIWMIQACTPLIQSRNGTIINLSSPAAEIAITGAALYSAVKGGIAALTRQQAGELGPHGIRVNAIAPGPVVTPGTQQVIDKTGWEARRQRTPSRRLATAAEVGRAAVYLASDDAASINGATIKLDGGLTITGP